MNGGQHPHPEALYYHIAKNALNTAMQLDSTGRGEFLKAQQIATVLVFTSLCFESFINQEFHKHSETIKVIENDYSLSLETKWLILPLLLGASATFDKGKEPFQSFEVLAKIRNQRLVHFKPKKETRELGKEYKDEYFGDLLKNVSLAERYFKCANEMIRKLNELTNGKTDVPKFLDGSEYLSTIWADAELPYEFVKSQEEK